MKWWCKRLIVKTAIVMPSRAFVFVNIILVLIWDKRDLEKNLFLKIQAWRYPFSWKVIPGGEFMFKDAKQRPRRCNFSSDILIWRSIALIQVDSIKSERSSLTYGTYMFHQVIFMSEEICSKQRRRRQTCSTCIRNVYQRHHFHTVNHHHDVSNDKRKTISIMIQSTPCYFSGR